MTETIAPRTANDPGIRLPRRERPPRPAAAPEPHRAPYLALSRVTDTAVAVAVLLGAFLLANVQRMPGGLDDFLGMRITLKNLVMLMVFAAVWRAACLVAGLYDWNLIRSSRTEVQRVLAACTVGATLALMFPLMSKTGAFSFAAVGYFWVGTSLGTLALRRAIRLATTPGPGAVRDIVIVGSGPRAGKLYRDLCRDSASYHVLGFVDSGAPVLEEFTPQMLGSLEQLESLLMHRAVDEVLIALPVRSCYREIQQAIEVCQRVGVRSKYLSDVFDHVAAKPQGEESGGFGFTAMVMAPEDHRMVMKRGIDLLGATVGLVLALPVMAVAAAAIKLTSPGPVLFVQERYGFNRRRFRMFKFRTMVSDAEAAQVSLEDRNEVDGPVFKIKDDPRAHRGGQGASADVHRRAAAAGERAGRRHVAGRPPAAAGPRRTAIQRIGTHAALQHASRTHLSLAGQRAQQRGIRRLDQARSSIHRRVVPGT